MNGSWEEKAPAEKLNTSRQAVSKHIQQNPYRMLRKKELVFDEEVLMEIQSFISFLGIYFFYFLLTYVQFESNIELRRKNKLLW